MVRGAVAADWEEVPSSMTLAVPDWELKPSSIGLLPVGSLVVIVDEEATAVAGGGFRVLILWRTAERGWTGARVLATIPLKACSVESG